MTEPPSHWFNEFTESDLATIQTAIPQAIRAGQERSSRAQTDYADPDGDQDVYGAGMARAVQKELASRLQTMSSYREELIPGSRRKLTFIGDALLFPHRVGKRMPRNHLRVRLNYLPEARRELLTETSNVKYGEPTLFDLTAESDEGAASLAEVLEVVEYSTRITLFVPYYSSTAAAVGSMYWGRRG